MSPGHRAHAISRHEPTKHTQSAVNHCSSSLPRVSSSLLIAPDRSSSLLIAPHRSSSLLRVPTGLIMVQSKCGTALCPLHVITTVLSNGSSHLATTSSEFTDTCTAVAWSERDISLH